MKKINAILILSALFFATSLFSADLPKTPSAEGAKVYFIGLKDGKTVNKNFTVRFGLKGMGIAPAGVVLPDTGHHHLLIDTDELPDFNVPLGASEKLVHFGKGQTETQLKLSPGKHTLQLVFADYIHLPHNPPVVSEKITITVK
ncbi:MAG: DUF4399 domain-containing protein [Verrucomicrobia bacterium]|nr:DUF4399 domain-containing protein [Verrucomicrobiota bacterium]MDA1065732.1 DUF4399 domain-containing protein [Verrucomicrobiota bacterium]